jgi:hypothetical protein
MGYSAPTPADSGGWGKPAAGRQDMEKAPSVEEQVLAKLRELSDDKRQEVLDFAEFLARKTPAPCARRSLKGLWAGLEVDLTEDDIAAARREMWSEFPRGDVQ